MNLSSKFDQTIHAQTASRWLWCLIIATLALGAWNAFIQDDAFISFRYAHNLVAGHGLTWNPGEIPAVEGYTNFLWVMLISALIALGIDPVTGSLLMSGIIAAGTLYFTYRLATLLLQSRIFGLVTVALLGGNFTYSCYITGGLETQLQCFLLISAAYLTFHLTNPAEGHRHRELVTLSLLFALAIMTRLDSVLICAVLYLTAAASILRHGTNTHQSIRRLLALTLPACVLGCTWFLFKYQYYGEILPNTFYVKGSGFSEQTLSRGLWYVRSFLQSYWLLPFLVLAIIFIKRLLLSLPFFILTILVALWCVYVIRVGGDFMEYRLLVPILPFVFILISRLIQSTGILPIQIGLALMVLGGSVNHALTFSYDDEIGIESIQQLQEHIVAEDQDWRGIGQRLGELYRTGEPPVSIAVTAAGAIAYYSELPVIDMLGLNDRWVARSGPQFNHRRPGHTRYATPAYLNKRRVNLVIGNPDMRPLSAPADPDPSSFFWMTIDLDSLPEQARIIEIPINNSHKLRALYLQPHDEIEASIHRAGLKTYAIAR